MIADPSNMLWGNSGKIGKKLYQRVVNGKTIVQKCPERKKIKVGPDMPVNNKRFHFATKWASAIRKNKEVAAQYEAVAKGTNSAYTMAVKDYLPPNGIIPRINTTRISAEPPFASRPGTFRITVLNGIGYTEPVVAVCGCHNRG